MAIASDRDARARPSTHIKRGGSRTDANEVDGTAADAADVRRAYWSRRVLAENDELKLREQQAKREQKRLQRRRPLVE
jgi:hypothetical protein